MLYRPARSKRFIIVMNRPALISVTHGTLRALSFKSTLNAPDIRGPSDSTARRDVCTTAGSTTVLASAAIDDTPLGWLPPPKYDRRSTVLISTSRPSRHSPWH